MSQKDLSSKLCLGTLGTCFISPLNSTLALDYAKECFPMTALYFACWNPRIWNTHHWNMKMSIALIIIFETFPGGRLWVLQVIVGKWFSEQTPGECSHPLPHHARIFWSSPTGNLRVIQWANANVICCKTTEILWGMLGWNKTTLNLSKVNCGKKAVSHPTLWFATAGKSFNFPFPPH